MAVVVGMSERKFRVGTFTTPGSKRIACYTTWYNPTWARCVEFVVEVKNGTEAKKKAAELRRAREVELLNESFV